VVLLASFYLYHAALQLSVNIAAFAASVLWAACGWTAARREVVGRMQLFGVCSVLSFGYVAWKIYDLHTNRDASYPAVTLHQFIRRG